MYDFWEIHIPFHEKHCIAQRVGAGACDVVGMVDLEECGRRGLQLGSRRVEFSIDGEGKLHDLYHPWESLPSSFTDVACKLHQAHLKRSWPCIAIKASPAKLLQGHNVYGPDCAATGILELLSAFCRALPGVAEMLDFGSAHLRRVDVTYSIQLPDAETMANCLASIGQLSHRHLRAAKEADYESTIYFNRRSQDQQDAGRTKVLVVYAKLNEMQHQLERLERSRRNEKTSRYDSVIEALKSPELQSFAENRLRFEGRGLTRWFERNNIPRNVWQFLSFVAKFEQDKGISFCEWAWRDLFSDMFVALGDSKVNLTQDGKVLKLLREHYGRCKTKVAPDGSHVDIWNFTRPDRLMMFYRSLATDGWDKVKRLTASSSFYDSVNALLGVGISKAQLQNLRQKKTLKLLQLIKVDFDQQRPAGYVEPVGTVLDTRGDIFSAGNKFGQGFIRKFGMTREQLIAHSVSELTGQPVEQAKAYVSHLIAGRALRLSGELGGYGGEQLHLAVFDDGSFELVRGNVEKFSAANKVTVTETPQQDPDELIQDFADYLGPAPLDARSDAENEHRNLSALLDTLRDQYDIAYRDPKRIGEALDLKDKISHTKTRIDRLWWGVYQATDSRGRTINQGDRP